MKEKLKYIKRYIKENWKKERSLPLFIITYFYTLGIWVMIILDSVIIGFYTPDFLVRSYTWGLLLGYIVLKAHDRSRRIEWRKRPGEKLVYLWWFTLLILGFAEGLTRGMITVPPITIEIAGSVLALYLGSICLNHYVDKKVKPPQEQSLADYGPDLKTRLTTTMLRQ